MTFTRMNKYTPDFRDYRVNYGIGLAMKPFRWMTLHAAATANAVYGGIGVNFSNL